MGLADNRSDRCRWLLLGRHPEELMRFLWVGLARAGVALVYISVSIVCGLVAAGGRIPPRTALPLAGPQVPGSGTVPRRYDRHVRSHAPPPRDPGSRRRRRAHAHRMPPMAGPARSRPPAQAGG